MTDRAEMRAVFRRVVDEGGDVVDVADVARGRGWGRNGPVMQTALAFREEFGLSVRESLDFAGWIEDERVPDAADRAKLRASITTPLR